jgi:hypothetical protein
MAKGARDRERVATLGTSLPAGVRLAVTCRACRHQVELHEPEIAGQVERLGAGLALLEWGRRLVCSDCSGREIDVVVSGYQPPAADWTQR